MPAPTGLVFEAGKDYYVICTKPSGYVHVHSIYCIPDNIYTNTSMTKFAMEKVTLYGYCKIVVRLDDEMVGNVVYSYESGD